jgi:hypothetical protein
MIMIVGIQFSNCAYANIIKIIYISIIRLYFIKKNLHLFLCIVFIYRATKYMPKILCVYFKLVLTALGVLWGGSKSHSLP